MNYSGSLEEALKRPSKSQLDKAVQAARLYIGSSGARMKDQQKLYNAMMKQVNKIASATGMDSSDVMNQIDRQARTLGAIAPTPGKDI